MSLNLSTSNKIIIVTAILASLLEIIDTSIVNVAIPTMMGNLGATLESISWVVTGYIIANAIVLPIAGWMGLQFGRKNYYVGCILLFTATSVACGLAPNLATLVIFRVLQGFAGGALLPTSQALIQEQFPVEKAGVASAIYGMGVIIGPTIGPTLGGFLTDTFGWRSIFNINLPLGLLAAALAWWKVEDSPLPMGAAARPKSSVDVFGLVLLCFAVGCFQFVLERGDADDWFASSAICINAFLAAVAIPTFIWWELKKAPYPILDLRLFRHSAVRNGTMLMTALGFMLYSIIFMVPVFASSLMGFSATQTGLLFIPGALVSAFLMPLVGAQLRKHDARLLILIGIVIVEAALFLMTDFTPQSGERDLFLPLFVRGLGMAFLFVPINTVVLGQFRGVELGQVAGLMNLFRQIGGSVGIAGLSTLLSRFNAQNYADLVGRVSLLNPGGWQAYQSTLGSFGGRFSSQLGQAPAAELATKVMAGRVARQMLVMSFNQVMWVLLIGFGLALIPLSFMKIKNKITGPIDAH